MRQIVKQLLSVVIAFIFTGTLVSSEGISDDELLQAIHEELERRYSLELGDLYVADHYNSGDSTTPYFRLLEGKSCPEFIEKGKHSSQRNFCAEGYLNLCEFDELDEYLKRHKGVLDNIPFDPKLLDMSAWDLVEVEALQLMQRCLSGDATACILSADYVSSWVGHDDGRISGCALSELERSERRQVQQANWLLKGVELGNAQALQEFIAVTENGGLEDYVKQTDFKIRRKAQISILESLRTSVSSDEKFTSILENGLGDAYAYVGQFHKSYMSHTIACNLKNARSCYELGHQSSHGYGFLPKNHIKAIRYFDSAIQFGDKSTDPYTEKFLIYTDPDSPLFDLQKAASAVESCPPHADACREDLLALVAYLGEPIISWDKFDDIVMSNQYKADYANGRIYKYPILGPNDFSDPYYASNSFWLQTPSIWYLGSILKQCYARNTDACLLLSYIFSEQIWNDTGVKNLSSDAIKRRSIVLLLPQPNLKLSYKYLLMTEIIKLSKKYNERFYKLKNSLELSLSSTEKMQVQEAATSAKLWAFEN